MKAIIIIIIFIGITSIEVSGQEKAGKRQNIDTLITNSGGSGPEIYFEFIRGKKYSHPVIAVWIEDMNEKYIQTLYVSQSIAKGVFEHGQIVKGNWAPGEQRRPASLPYWAHQRGIKAMDGLYVPDATTAVPDAYTGATPLQSFLLKSKSDKQLPTKFRLYFEINQAFDWNDNWHNNQYPEDEAYKTSGQPSLVYAVTIDTQNPQDEYFMNPIGHGQYSGSDGKLYTDLSKFTTALQISGSIKVWLKK
jgi:hypothetical protein